MNINDVINTNPPSIRKADINLDDFVSLKYIYEECFGFTFGQILEVEMQRRREGKPSLNNVGWLKTGDSLVAVNFDELIRIMD